MANFFEFEKPKMHSELDKYRPDSMELQDEIGDMISVLKEQGIFVSEAVVEKEFLDEIELAKNNNENIGIEPIFNRVYEIHKPKPSQAETMH